MKQTLLLVLIFTFSQVSGQNAAYDLAKLYEQLSEAGASLESLVKARHQSEALNAAILAYAKANMDEVVGNGRKCAMVAAAMKSAGAKLGDTLRWRDIRPGDILLTNGYHIYMDLGDNEFVMVSGPLVGVVSEFPGNGNISIIVCGKGHKTTEVHWNLGEVDLEVDLFYMIFCRPVPGMLDAEKLQVLSPYDTILQRN